MILDDGKISARVSLYMSCMVWWKPWRYASRYSHLVPTHSLTKVSLMNLAIASVSSIAAPAEAHVATLLRNRTTSFSQMMSGTIAP
jgi:hypothetical protein